MCGIIGYSGNRNAVPILLEGLSHLEYRGYDSAGIAFVHEHQMALIKESGKLKNLKNKVSKNDFSLCGIGHTRWATHGEPTQVNSHPHISFDGCFSVVHNGIIENYLELKKNLEENGVKFITKTDTEVIAHLLAYHYDGDVLSCIKKTTDVLEGSYALCILTTYDEGAIYCAKKSSPLLLAKGQNENFIISDVHAVSQYSVEVLGLNDGEFAMVHKNVIKVFDNNLMEISKEFKKANNDYMMSQKNGFEHYMLKEIYEQPQIIRNMLQKRVKEDYILMNELTRVNIDLKNAERVYIVACGSAYHAGMVGKYVIEELCKIPVEVDYASEFRYREPLVNKHTPVIFISQSGETADTLASLRLANEKGATTIGIVNVRDSSIARECDCVLYTEAGTEIAVATTKGYTSQLMMLYLFALNIMQLKNDISKEELSRFIRQLKNIPQKMDNIIYDTSDILTLADQYYTKENIFFIGRNMDYALSLEGSLKLKEISYINSQAYPAGELKHGTIALIDDQSLVISLCANKRLLPKTLSNVEETTARGAQIICLTPRENQELFDSRTKFIFIEKMDDILMPLVEIIPLQLFAYYVAKNKGADIDMPKNLAKSVTVE